MSCWCGRQGFWALLLSTMCTVWRKLLHLHTVHIVLSSSDQKPCLPHQQDIIPYVVKISVLRSWRWAKVCPKHVELILAITKTVIVASSWCSILLYLHISLLYSLQRYECSKWPHTESKMYQKAVRHATVTKQPYYRLPVSFTKPRQQLPAIAKLKGKE
jgi:hypothetical protein